MSARGNPVTQGGESGADNIEGDASFICWIVAGSAS